MVVLSAFWSTAQKATGRMTLMHCDAGSLVLCFTDSEVNVAATMQFLDGTGHRAMNAWAPIEHWKDQRVTTHQT